ncbi:MAG: hypothetical protein E7463_00355 [Ruminococcaceae bacterium]|nr:hypothetical protein [Oscillospiraceae bacterium]
MATVYLDVLFLLNASVDWLLLRSSAYIARCPVKHTRLAAAACVGGLFACLCFFLTLPGWFVPLMRAAGAVLLCMIAFRCESLHRLGILCALFWGLSCLYAGLMTAFLQYAPDHNSGLQMQNGVGYINIPAMVFILSALSLYLLSGLLSAFSLTADESLTVPLTIRCGSGYCTLTALRDSGHSLRDLLTGREAAIVSWPAVRALFSPAIRSIIDCAGTEPTKTLTALGDAGLSAGFGLLPCRTVQGRGLILTYSGCAVCIDERPVPMLLALTAQPLSESDSYQAIISANRAQQEELS